MGNNSNNKGNNNMRPVRVLWKGNFITLRGRAGIKGESLFLDYHITENGKKIRKYGYLKKLEVKKTYSRDQQKENI